MHDYLCINQIAKFFIFRKLESIQMTSMSNIFKNKIFSSLSMFSERSMQMATVQLIFENFYVRSVSHPEENWSKN